MLSRQGSLTGSCAVSCTPSAPSCAILRLWFRGASTTSCKRPVLPTLLCIAVAVRTLEQSALRRDMARAAMLRVFHVHGTPSAAT